MQVLSCPRCVVGASWSWPPPSGLAIIFLNASRMNEYVARRVGKQIILRESVSRGEREQGRACVEGGSPLPWPNNALAHYTCLALTATHNCLSPPLDPAVLVGLHCPCTLPPSLPAQSYLTTKKFIKSFQPSPLYGMHAAYHHPAPLTS